MSIVTIRGVGPVDVTDATTISVTHHTSSPEQAAEAVRTVHAALGTVGEVRSTGSTVWSVAKVDNAEFVIFYPHPITYIDSGEERARQFISEVLD